MARFVSSPPGARGAGRCRRRTRRRSSGVSVPACGSPRPRASARFPSRRSTATTASSTWPSSPAGARAGRPPGRGGRVTTLGARIKGLRAGRELQQRQLAEKAELTPSMVSQIESGRLTPSLHTLGRVAAALGVPIGALFDGQPSGSIVVTRKKDYPVVSFDGSSEHWAVLDAGLFQGQIRAVASTLGPNERGVTTEKVVIKRGQMKLFYVIDGKVALHYNGDRHLLEAGDSALLDGGTPHGWENLGTKRAQADRKSVV